MVGKWLWARHPCLASYWMQETGSQVGHLCMAWLTPSQSLMILSSQVHDIRSPSKHTVSLWQHSSRGWLLRLVKQSGVVWRQDGGVVSPEWLKKAHLGAGNVRLGPKWRASYANIQEQTFLSGSTTTKMSEAKSPPWPDQGAEKRPGE